VSTARDILALADKVETLLISGKSDHAVKRELGLHRNKASRMVRMVRERWVNEAGKVDRDQKRAQLREMILEHYRECMEATVPVTVWSTRETQTGEMKANPDLRAAGRALELLCRFDGLLEQPETPGGPSLTIAEKVYQIYFGGAPPPQPALARDNVIDMPVDDGKE
jgi:hypothetical protein